MSSNWTRYREAVKEMDRAFDELYQQTADEAGPRRLLDELKPLIEKRRDLVPEIHRPGPANGRREGKTDRSQGGSQVTGSDPEKPGKAGG